MDTVREVQSGTIEITRLYANNEMSEVKLEIYLSGHDWYEIKDKEFFRELAQYLCNLKTQEILNGLLAD